MFYLFPTFTVFTQQCFIRPCHLCLHLICCLQLLHSMSWCLSTTFYPSTLSNRQSPPNSLPPLIMVQCKSSCMFTYKRKWESFWIYTQQQNCWTWACMYLIWKGSVRVPARTSLAAHEGCYNLSSSSTFSLIHLLNFCYPTMHKVISHFNLHFSNQYCFLCLLAYWLSSHGNLLFLSFIPCLLILLSFSYWFAVLLCIL